MGNVQYPPTGYPALRHCQPAGPKHCCALSNFNNRFRFPHSESDTSHAIRGPARTFPTSTASMPRLLITPPEIRSESTRLNSSHGYISYAVFCLKKKKNTSKIE